jgi:hypothetical protein
LVIIVLLTKLILGITISEALDAVAMIIIAAAIAALLAIGVIWSGRSRPSQRKPRRAGTPTADSRAFLIAGDEGPMIPGRAGALVDSRKKLRGRNPFGIRALG